ncbi:hypothetical protein SCHPADRAFT_834632, partial [Schizopora paradoxa]
VPFGVTYEKIGTIQRRLAWPLHKDDTLFRVECTSVHNIYCSDYQPMIFCLKIWIRFLSFSFTHFSVELRKSTISYIYR